MQTRSGLFLTYQHVDFLNQHLIWLANDGSVIRDLTIDYPSIFYAYAMGDTVTLVEHMIAMFGDSTYYDLVTHSYNANGDLIARDTLLTDMLPYGFIVAGYTFSSEQGQLTAAVITAVATHNPVLYSAHLAHYTVAGGGTVYAPWDPGPVPMGSYVDYWAVADAPDGSMVLGFHLEHDDGSEFWFQATDPAGNPLRYVHTVTLGAEQANSGLDIHVAYGSVYAMYMTFSPSDPLQQGAYMLGFPLENVLAVEGERRVPVHEYALSAYPNPFNAETTIPFRLSNTGPVSVRVYDLVGRQVATLVNDTRPAGDYEVRWSGHDLPSGIYLARLETPAHTRVQKLVLLK